MKMSKNGRKTQKAIRRALMLGLPVAGLLLTAGCDRQDYVIGTSQVKEDHRLSGSIAYDPDYRKDKDDKFSDDKVVEK